MAKEFIIRESIDAEGHRVIVYEFPGATAARARRKPAGPRSRIPRSSFIKVTFERPPARDRLDDR